MTDITKGLNYRYLTGPDDREFCQRISDAINEGWQLYGSPSVTFDSNRGRVICAQALVRKNVPTTREKSQA
jgi:hypothetical protein